MGTRQYTIERFSIQAHSYTIIESQTAQARCQGRMTVEAFEAKLAEMFDLYVYPDPDQRLDFWLAVEAEMETEPTPEPEPVTIYEMAEAAVERKQQWTAGESVTLWSENGQIIEVTEGGYDGGCQLFLVFRNGKPGQQAQTACGFLNPLKGWRFSLTADDYDRWASEARRIA